MILPLLGSILLRDLDAIQIQRAFNLMPYAPSTKQLARVVLNAILTKARKHTRLITEDLCEDLALPPVRYHHVRTIAPDEVGKFLEACRTHRDGLLVACALLTGMRKSELLQLVLAAALNELPLQEMVN